MLNISSNGNSYLMKYFFCFFLFVVAGCQPSTSEYYNDEAEELSSDFKAYWFDGTAEISSYKLIQSRYGDPREGEAVLIYVTEDRPSLISIMEVGTTFNSFNNSIISFLASGLS